MIDYKKINRENFMMFYRDNEKLNELTVDDRNEILSDYIVDNIEIIEFKNGEK